MRRASWLALKELLLDALFPPTCQGCGVDGTWLCQSCLHAIPVYAEDRPDPLEGAKAHLAPGIYGDPLWRKLILSLKYHSASCLEESFKQILRRMRSERKAPWPWAHERALYVVSIPGDPKRLRARGFDHAAFLSMCIRRVLVPWSEPLLCLTKQRQTRSNALLPTDSTRRLNIQKTFFCDRLITKPVLLVDDVCTTGATLEEGIRALREAGCPRIYLFTMAMAQGVSDAVHTNTLSNRIIQAGTH